MAFVPTVPTVLTPGLKHVCGHAPSASRLLPTVPPVAAASRQAPRMSAASRKFLVGGNWKCNLNTASISDLVAGLNAGTALDNDSVEVVVFPPMPYIKSVRDILRPDFAVAAQNSWISGGGAFTGEVDTTMIADIGCTWLLLGHSERRHTPEINESDETIATKAAHALEHSKLSVMYCIGELLSEREEGRTIEVCTQQLDALKAKITQWDRVAIAYEPVWAIGTGKVATPEQAEEVHAAVRKWMQTELSPDVANSMRILYGGSVSPDNCKDIAKKPNVDGFLVGGASLKPNFLEIVDSHKTALAGAV